MLIRVGLPLVNGSLPRAARRLGLPVLVSTNAFRQPSGRWKSTAHLAGLDCALDSAGFVAQRLYGGYPWTTEQYLDLVASRPEGWAWWAQQDLCCEPEVAGAEGEVQRRQDETARLYVACAEGAALRGLQPPMPVLQGWTPADYLRAVQTHPAGAAWPSLVGVGSMCRRSVAGPVGLRAVLRVLDSALPAHVRLHLFGVKSASLAALADHPRLLSTDSCAWDFAARCRARAGAESCTMALRIEEMERWATKQNRACDTAQQSLW